MRRIVSAALCVMVLLAAHVARAQTFAFTLGSGSIDTAGFFGPVGGDLSGKIALITIDFPPGYMCAIQGALGSPGYYWCNGNSHINPHLKTTVKVTINGQSQQQTMSSPQVQYLSGFSCIAPYTYNGVNVPQGWRIGSSPNIGITQTFLLDYVSTSNAACPTTVDSIPPALAVPPSGTTSSLLQWSFDICSTTPQYFCAPSESSGTQSDAFSGQPGAFAIAAVNPYLLHTPSQADINLATALGSVPDTAIATAQASALAADGVSAFIALVQTSSADAVTFSVTGGGTLLKYDPVFLQTPPKAGAHKVTVGASEGVTINGVNYIPVLVQGPLNGAPNYKAPIIVTAVQDGNTLTTAIGLVPPPLITVHGLWGDQGSFTSFVSYISKVAPWSSQTSEIGPICYSKVIGFNQIFDLLSGGGDPCEVTATSALSSAIATLLTNDTLQGVVASRVDIVAHSMGGLVARFYSSQPGFRSVRNRNWGQFNHVITLDTPELGSQLAPFLLSNLTDTLLAPKSFSSVRKVWQAMCGSSYETSTLLQCFANQGLPVSYMLNGTEIGAVSSLDPNGSAIGHLASPAIPNATWSALAANASGDDTLGYLLNRLIAGTTVNPSDPNVPTLDSLLGTPNDEIVSLISQLDAGVGAAASVTVPNLQHTSVLPHHISDEFHTSDESVVDDPSDTVNGVVRCWLEQGGAANCQPAPAASAAVTPAPKAPALSPDMMAPTLPATMELGRAYRISLHLAGPRAIADLSATQIGAYARAEQSHITIDRAAGIATITPTLPGPISIEFNATDAAGDVMAARARSNVVLPAGPPAQFRAHDLPLLVIDLATPDPVARLHPSARYAGLPKPVPLDARYVTLQAAPEDGRDALAISPTGLIRALRQGKGTLIAHLGTATAKLPYSVIDSRGDQ